MVRAALMLIGQSLDQGSIKVDAAESMAPMDATLCSKARVFLARCWRKRQPGGTGKAAS